MAAEPRSVRETVPGEVVKQELQITSYYHIPFSIHGLHRVILILIYNTHTCLLFTDAPYLAALVSLVL